MRCPKCGLLDYWCKTNGCPITAEAPKPAKALTLSEEDEKILNDLNDALNEELQTRIVDPARRLLLHLLECQTCDIESRILCRVAERFGARITRQPIRHFYRKRTTRIGS